MNDDDLLRYSRQILLPEIDIDGQQRLLAATVLIIGLGGLGSPAAMYLAAAGVGTLVLVDPDRVELSNLQRQIIHDSKDIGRPKVDSAHERIAALNPGCNVRIIVKPLDVTGLIAEAKHADVVVDATDNFTARYAINKACIRTHRPLVSAAATRFRGQISVFDHRSAESPCYACLFGDADDTQESCTESGVIAPLLGVLGSLQALETVKLITNTGKTLQGRVVVFDGLRMEWRSSILRKDPECAICGGRGLALSGS